MICVGLKAFPYGYFEVQASDMYVYLDPLGRNTKHCGICTRALKVCVLGSAVLLQCLLMEFLGFPSGVVPLGSVRERILRLCESYRVSITGPSTGGPHAWRTIGL